MPLQNVNLDKQDLPQNAASGVSSVVRVDRSTFPKVSRTPEGYLRGEAVVTRLGVFLYTNPDGSVRRELRHPDDVLKADSLATLGMIPITVDHPKQLVTSENAAELSVGMTGENPRIDGRNIIVPLTVTHADGILAVNDGIQELSCGYSVELVPEVGEYNGEPYTHRQTNIVYNHLALVSKARAGSSARLNLDGAAVQSIDQPGELKMSEKLVSVNLDGLNYDAAPEVAKALQKAQARIDEMEEEKEEEKEDMKATKADMQKKIDEYQAKIDEMKAEMDKMKETNSDSAIDKAVTERLELIGKASKIVKDSAELAGKNARQIMEATIKAKYADINLDGKSDDYVSARFDAIIDAIPADAAADAVAKTTPKQTNGDRKDPRADALEAILNQSKVKEAK